MTDFFLYLVIAVIFSAIGFIIGKFLIPTLYTKTDKTKNFGLVLILFLVLLVSGGYLFFPTSEGLITIMFSGIATNLFLKDSKLLKECDVFSQDTNTGL